MPRYVVMTGDPRYTAEGRTYLATRWANPGRDLLGVLNQWAETLDYSDGITSPRPTGGPLPTPSAANTYMHYVVPCPSASTTDRSADHRRDTVLRVTLASYRDAARWAGRGGELGIMFNHSRSGEVHLGPGGWLWVPTLMLERIHRLRETGGDLSPEERAVSEIGDILHGGPDHPTRRPAIGRRTRPFIRRVNLLSCSVRLGEPGQAFLDWLQVVWGVPVRGLRGALVIAQDSPDTAMYTFVLPGERSATFGPDSVEFFRPRVNDPHMHPALWATSRDIVPTPTP